MAAPNSESRDRRADMRSPLLPHPVPAARKEKLCMDAMLERHCGEFGAWQLRHFVLTSLAWALEALHTMVMIFADREPDFRCVGPGCDATADSVCGLPSGSWDWVGGPAASTVSEWGLVCGHKYKVGLVQALFFAGCMIGAGVFGHLSDSKLGRKGSLTVVCILNTIFGCLTAFSPDFLTYVLLRALTGFSTGGAGLCAFVLATEPVGAKRRGAAGMSTFYFFSLGIATLAGVAYAFPSWRELYIASSIPSLLFLLFVLPFLSDSPRWYLVRGRNEEAMEIMRKIARSNGRHLPDGAILALDEEVDNDDDTLSCKEEEEEEEEEVIPGLETSKGAVTGTLVDVIRSPLTRIRLILAFAINFACSVVYYGLSLNAVNLETNLHLTVLLNSVFEMPAFAITAILLDRCGRKPLAIATQWFSAFFCFIGCFVGDAGPWKVVRMVCGLLGIFGMAGTYNLLFIYTTELFPTVVRNAALGCTTQAAQMGAILAPVVVVLGDVFPFAVFALCGFVGGVFAYYLPETLHKPLYDTMAGMEKGDGNGRSVV